MRIWLHNNKQYGEKMQPIYTETENSMQQDEIRYKVYIDEDDLNLIAKNNGSSFDFGDEIANKEYVNRFKNNELCSFGIVKLQVCKCCCEWSEKDSLWGIHAESPQAALNYFKEHCGI